MNGLQAGFSRVDVTPMTGIGICGYYKERHAEGVLDPLEINALALRCADKTIVMMSIDNCHIAAKEMDWIRAAAAKKCGLPAENIWISCTHTHTGPFVERDAEDPLVAQYTDWLLTRFEDAALYAVCDLAPARMGFGTGTAPNIAFVRRYLMKNGEIHTNPGVNNPDIVRPCGDVDERVHVLRFDREGRDDIVLVNFGDHPDTVGGNLISADWPGFVRMRLEKALDGVRCLFFNGAQGDVNHVNVHPKGGDLNDMFMDFDDVSRGYGHARHMGNVVAAAVLQVFDKVEYRDVEDIRCLHRRVRVPSSMPAPEDMPEARRICEMHAAGRDAEMPWKGMMLTTVVAEAQRMVKLEHGPEAFDMDLAAVAIGDIAFVGLPGEPFTGIGLGLKANGAWTAVLPCCLTNGAEGYFPMMDAYEEGGYEARSSRFRPGVAELLIKEGNALLDELKKA